MKKSKFPTPKLFIPKNPEKYQGNHKNIISRSSYETKFMNYVDNNQAIIKWSSEETIIPYISPVDNQTHRYFIDFKMTVRNNGVDKTYIVEIKPESQTKVPLKNNKRNSTYINEMMTYAVNEAKWNSAIRYAKDRNYEFIIITEKHLGIK